MSGRVTDGGMDVLHKFGRVLDVDTATTPEDVWDGGGVYPWPTSAIVPTIVSDDAADAAAGTGARTVTIEGLDADYMMISETATLDGATPVSFVLPFFRVYRAYVVTAGSGETNAGNLLIKHGATTIAQITAEIGQTLMAIYTTPADYSKVWGIKNYAQVMKTTATVVELALQTKLEGGAWRTQEVTTLRSASNSSWQYEFPCWRKITPKMDVRWRVLSVSANDTDVVAGFDMIMER